MQTMKINPFKKAGLVENATGSGKVTSKMVQERAGALAELKGRYAHDVTESDLAQARRELMGKTDART